MSYIKLVLIVVGLLVAAMFALSIFSIVYSALWYLFLFGIVAVGGVVGYKLFIKDKESPRLEAGTPTGIAEMKNADRALEEYKRKHLTK